MAAKDYVAPVQLAKQMGIKPQEIYSMIKRGKINAYGEKPQKVDPDEVKRALEAVRHHVRGKGKGTLEPKKSPVKRGQVVSWDRGGRKKDGTFRGHTIAQVFDTEADALTWLQNTTGDSTIPFSTDGLQARIVKGEVRIEHPLALLQMVADEFRVEGFDDLADAVQAALGVCKEGYTSDNPASLAVYPIPSPIGSNEPVELSDDASFDEVGEREEVGV